MGKASKRAMPAKPVKREQASLRRRLAAAERRLRELRRRYEAVIDGANETVRDQATLLQAIVAQIPNAVFAKDREGRFTLANRGWSEMSGVPAEKAIGRTVHDLYPADAAKRFAEEDEKLLARGAAAQPTEALHQGPRPDQYRIVRKAVLSRDDGTVLGLVASSTDISALKRVEEQLSNQIKFTNDLFESVPIALSLRDGDGKYLYVNRTWERYFESRREDVVGKTMHQRVAKDVADRVLAEDRAALARGPGAPARLTDYVYKGRQYTQTRNVIADAQGRTLGVLTATLDTTERHAIEQALAEERHRLALVVSATQAGIVDWDMATEQPWYSERFKEMLGYPRDADTALWPSLFGGLIHAEDRDRCREVFFAGLVAPGAPNSVAVQEPIELRLRRADGGWLWVESMGLTLRDERGEAKRYLAAVLDITERRAQEEALKESVRLREEVERMSRHDLKTPLNSVIAVSRLLRESAKFSPEDEELLSIVERAGYRILSMVNLSLDLYRMEQGTYVFHPQAIDLSDVARKVAADLEGQAASKSVGLRLRQSGRSLARAEELLCYSMLANLVKNAIEATPEGGVTSVTVEGKGDTVCVHVHNPLAVPEKVRARFFDKYASTGKSAGLGLGTYSARLMAQVQEGDLTLHTTEADGTTVSVRLRAAHGEAHAGQAPAATGTRAERLPALPALRVLVVDDDEFNRLVLRRMLPSPPLTLAMAVNGRAAIDAAQAEWPDVVLLDLEMPVMDGYEAARRLRELQKAHGKPLRIVAISSNDEAAIMRRALEAGCDHYLVKPAPRESLFRLLAGEAVEQDALRTEPVAHDGPPPQSLELDAQLRDTLAGFLDSRRKLLDEAATAIASSDRAVLRRVAHRVAGSLALYGFEWASLKARSVEDDAHVGDLAALADRLQAVRAHLDNVQITYREAP